jgi:hypothetical protein
MLPPSPKVDRSTCYLVFDHYQKTVAVVIIPCGGGEREGRAMPSVVDLIVEAIHKKWIVTAIYQGYQRIMCPHVIGYKYEKDGSRRLNALFFQFAGGSKSGLPPGGMWRCIHVDELSNVSIPQGSG